MDPHLEARKLVNHGEPQLHICYETTIVSDGVVCVVFEHVKDDPAFLADPTKRGNQVLFLRAALLVLEEKICSEPRDASDGISVP